MNEKKKKRRLIWIGTIALIAAILVGGGLFVRQRAQAKEGIDPDQVVTAYVGELSAETSASGQLTPQREALLSLATAGRVEEVLVEAGDAVKAGDALVQLEHAALERAVRTAEQTLAIQQANLAELLSEPEQDEIVAARAAVESAQAQLADLLDGPTVQDLAAAEAAVTSAQAQLDELLAGPGEEQLASARTALDSAIAQEKVEAERYAALDAQRRVARQQLDIAAIELENARYFYNALKNDWQHKDYADFSPEAEALKDAQTAYNVALARYNLNVASLNDSAYRTAQAQVAQARANLAALTDTPTVEIASAREQLAQAQANLNALVGDKAPQIASAQRQLAQAEANLSNLTQGAKDERIDIARAQVAQAEIALADARDRLAEATMVAPFDGTVTAVYVAEGEWATGQAVELVDTQSMQVVLDVDEIDISQVYVGQSTRVILDPWPDQSLEGRVDAIAPSGSAQSGIVTYRVHVTIYPGDLPVRTGMTANADLITSEREDVLLVANRAITADRSANKFYVHRLQGDTIQEVEVTIGLRDNSHTEITSGLEAGDKLVINYVEDGLPFGPPG